MVVRRISVGIAAVFALLATVLAAGASAQTAWSCDGQAATIVGTPGADNLRGTPGADVIVARQGNDVIDGLGGDDIICAGKGNDRIFGGGGFDVIFGAQGNDTIYAASGATAATRADTKGARMFGGAGDDTIHGSNKWDRMQGGPGTDALLGYEGRDWMRAGAGNDAVDGGPGIDDLHGGNGADFIVVSAGDVVKGGAGFDLCDIAGEPASIKSCGRDEREEPPESETVSTGFELQVGQCLNLSAGGDFTKAGCTELHDFQVYYLEDMPNGPYPGIEAVRTEAETICLDQYEPFIGEPYLTSIYFISTLKPSPEGWAQGDREIACLVTTEFGQLDKDLRGVGE